MPNQTPKFVMRGYTPELVNTYDCVDCKAAGRPHEIQNLPAGVTDRTSWMGSGIPQTIRKCTGCGAQDGPWIDAKYAEGY